MWEWAFSGEERHPQKQQEQSTVKRARSEAEDTEALPTSARKFARGQAKATRLQRLGLTAAPGQAITSPVIGQVAANQPAATDRRGFKMLIAQVSNVRGISKQKAGEPSEAGANDLAPERRAKRAKVGTAECFRIHEVAVRHSMADSESEADASRHGDGASWWDGVEALIEVDLEADRKWWGEIEVAIIADAAETSCSCREPDAAGKKRQLSSSQPSAAKRLRRPG